MKHVCAKVLLLAAVCGLVDAAASAQVQPGLRLRGLLTDLLGVPYEGPRGVTFRIWDQASGGTALYTDSMTPILSAGVMDVVLGVDGTATGDLVTALSPNPMTGSARRYIGIQIDGDTELSPRRQITGGAYAFVALRASNADSLGGQPASTYVTASQAQAFATQTQLTNYVQANAPPNQPQTLSGAVTVAEGATVAFAQPTGQPPFSVMSTTVVNNLNAERLGGATIGQIARVDIDNVFERNNAFGGESRFEGPTIFAATTGTAPFMVSSTTLVTNLNAHRIGGATIEQLARVDIDNVFQRTNLFEDMTTFEGPAVLQGATTFSQSAQFQAPQGTPPFQVTSTTQVNGLNAALLNGLSSAQIIAMSGGGGGSCTMCSNSTQLGGQNASFYQDASNLTAGTINDARLAANVCRTDAPQTITAPNIYEANTLLVSSGTAETTINSAAATPQTVTLPNASGTLLTTGNLNQINSTGTITSGTWQGGIIGGAFGGTGFNVASLPDGAILRKTVTGWQALPPGSNGQVLKLDMGQPEWRTDDVAMGMGGGTVTSVGTGTGLTGGTITTSGTLSIDTAVVPRLNTANTFATGQTITGTGSTPSMVVGSAVGHSGPSQEWRDSSGSPTATMSPNGTLSLLSLVAPIGTVSAQFLSGSGASITNLNANNLGSGQVAAARGGTGIDTSTAATGSIFYRVNDTTWATLPRGSNGQVLKQSSNIPSWQADSVGSGTVTSVGTGDGLSGGAITTSGTLTVDSTVARKGINNAFTTQQSIQSGGIANVGLLVNGPLGQTANLQEWRVNNAAPLASISAAGGLTAATLAGSGSLITSLNATQLTSGTIPDGRISGTHTSAVTFNSGSNSFTGSFSGSGGSLTGLNATQLTSGTIPDGRISGTHTSPVTFNSGTNSFTGSFSGSGGSLTGLNATQLTSGTIPDGRISGTHTSAVTFNSGTNSFTGSFSGSGGSLTGLNATQLTSGTIPDGRISGTHTSAVTFNSGTNSFTGSFSGSGGSLTGLNATQLTSGTVPDGRLASTYAQAVSFTNTSNAYSGSASLSTANLSGALSLGTSVSVPAGGTSIGGTGAFSGGTFNSISSASLAGALTLGSTLNVAAAGTTIGGGSFSGGTFNSGTFNGTHSGDGSGLSGLSQLGVRKVQPNEGCFLDTGGNLFCDVGAGSEFCNADSQVVECSQYSGACKTFCIPDTGPPLQYPFKKIELNTTDTGELTITQTAQAVVCRSAQAPVSVEILLQVALNDPLNPERTTIGTAQATLASPQAERGAWLIIPQSTVAGSFQVTDPGLLHFAILSLSQITSTGLCFLLRQTQLNLRFVSGTVGALGND